MRTYLFQIMTDQNKRVDGVLMAVLLRLLSWVYALLLFGARGCYPLGLRKAHVLSRPVVSVGNLTMGGVGKTPLVEYLIAFLTGKGIQPAVLMRGYMPHGASKSDEKDLLRQKFPEISVVANKDRVRGAQEAERLRPVDMFLLDDGFQHWRVKRDLDIVALDASCPFGNGALIPRGILREPVSALSRADLCVLTKSDAVSPEQKQALVRRIKAVKDLPVLEGIHQPMSLTDIQTGQCVDLEELKGRTVNGFCGIGDPRGFERSVVQTGASLNNLTAFTDHHAYSQEDVETLVAQAKAGQIKTLVTTAKDAVKLNIFQALLAEAGVQCFILNVTFTFVNGEEEIQDGILSLLPR